MSMMLNPYRFVNAAPVALTWNPSDYDTLRGVLSNGNRTMERFNGNSNGSLYGTARVQVSKTTGKWYCEQRIDQFRAWIAFGVGISAASITGGHVGSDLNAIGLLSNGISYVNGASVGNSTASYTDADVMCMAADLVNRKVWFRKNNLAWLTGQAGTQDPATNQGGFSLPAALTLGTPIFVMGSVRQYSVGDVDTVTLRGDSAQWSYAAPSGFSAWGI